MNGKTLAFGILVSYGLSSCGSLTIPYAYYPSTREMSSKTKICDSVYFFPVHATAKLFHMPGGRENFTFDSIESKYIEAFSNNYLKSKIENKFVVRDISYKQAQFDSLERSFRKMIDAFYYKKYKSYTLDVSGLNTNKKGLGLIFLVDSEIKDDELMGLTLDPFFVHGKRPLKCMALTYLCLFDLKSGGVIYYQYNYKTFEDVVYLPDSLDKKTVDLTNSFRKTWGKIIDKNLHSLVKQNSCFNNSEGRK